MKKKFNKKTLYVLLAFLLITNASYAINENKNEVKNTVNEQTEIISQDTQPKKISAWTKMKTKFKKDKSKTAQPFETVVPTDKNGVLLESTTTVEEYKAQEIIKEVSKDKNIIKEAKAYTNDIHSAFTLEDCIKIAIEYNPQIRSSVYNAQMYKTKIGQAWANYFPVLGAGIQGIRNGTHYSGTQAESLDNTLGYLPSVSAQMLLFDFGKTKANADMYKKTYESKKSTTQEDINVLIYNIKTTYNNVLFAQVKVKVYEDTVNDYALQYKRALSFYKTGKKAKIDVITAKYNLGKAELNLVKAKNELEVANVELAKIMGIPEYTNFNLVSQLSTFTFDIEQDDAIAKAYDVRPELISAKKNVEAAKMNLRAKKRDYAPDINIFASYNNGLGTEYNLYDYKFGVGMNYNALNIAKIKKQIDEASLLYKKMLADYEDKKHTIYLNVKKAYLELKTAEESIIISKLALDEAKEQYRQASGRYDAGIGDAIELKDGETTYLNARLDFYNSLLNYNNIAANLEKEIGVPLYPSKNDILTRVRGI